MISVVIPTLNEAARIAGLVQALRDQPGACEVIVVDGASTDATVALAREAGADAVIVAPRGRGQQLAAGVARARGEVLWFLHADTEVPLGALATLTQAMAADPACPGGNFRLLFDGDDRFARWLEGFYAWLRRRGYYYGDSGVFIRRHVLDRLGGIRPIALMEDYDLVRRLERVGRTICIAAPPLRTSCRRFVGRHPVAIVAGWVRIHLLFLCGRAPGGLAVLYDSERRG
jgi:rSAM/selenodomain-associated transferase 2